MDIMPGICADKEIPNNRSVDGSNNFIVVIFEVGNACGVFLKSKPMGQAPIHKKTAKIP